MIKKLKYLLSLNSIIKNKEKKSIELSKLVVDLELERTLVTRDTAYRKRNSEMLNAIEYLLKPRFGSNLEYLFREFVDKLPEDRQNHGECLLQLVKDNVK